MNAPPPSRSVAIGVLCGVGAALLWAAGFVAARHGIDIGMTAADITFHRCFWAGLVLLPLAWRDGLADLNGIGWGRGLLLTFLGGPGIAFASYSGFHLVPLGLGGVIQPSSAALFGLLLATVVLLERLPPRRAAGALVIVAGLAVIGAEAIATIGAHGLLGAGRASVFPALVPPSVLLIGWLALGSVPTLLQCLGLVIVLAGFRLTQRN